MLSQESLVHLKWIKRAYCSQLTLSSFGRAAVRKAEDTSLNPAQANFSS